jgi:hypothetical protein
LHWPAAVGGGGSWDPSQLSSTSIWIDIDALGLSNGTGITTMTDQSGNNNDMSGTSTYATVVSADLNGLDVAQFNNVGGYTLSNWAGPVGNDGQVFAGVVEIDAVASSAYISETRADVPASQLTPLIYRSTQTLTPSNQRRDGADTDVDLSASVPSTTGWAIVVLAHDYTNGGINCLVNGTSVATGTLTSTGSGPETNLKVGLGSSAVNTLSWEHKIAEAIWFDDRLSTGSNGNLERVEGYLAHKYALTAKLPVSHPYKNAAP